MPVVFGGVAVLIVVVVLVRRRWSKAQKQADRMRLNFGNSEWISSGLSIPGSTRSDRDEQRSHHSDDDMGDIEMDFFEPERVKGRPGDEYVK